ncbi:MAG: glycosyltransferase family 4 protein [Gammaproteobacteria bacterium]|nr:glycosyltransferase family 4 protein [Gammaproteobacteria bacterium]
MSVCIYYHPEAYSTKGKKLMGRNAAGESFLKGFLMHSKPTDSFWVHNNNGEEVEDFARLARSYNRSEKIIPVNKKKYSRLKDASTLYYPGPDLAMLARQRRFFGDDAWSICGITHTTASAGAMDGIIELVSSPIREWDGLICPSTAVKGHVLNLIEAQKEYLGLELGASYFSLPEMPVIPLGVHLEDFVFSEQAKNQTRISLEIDEDSVVFLYVGRLSFHAKAHPLQMYKALEFAAKKTRKNLVLIECGWHGNDFIQNAFSDAAKEICPSVKIINLDGRVPEERDKAWSSADIFCSLSDNIQETFGIVPLEGMAAALPVVVSDWNGYKDSVADGVEGFRIPTIAPAPGLEGDLAFRHAMGIDTYDMYCGFSSTFIGVNMEALNNAFCRLVEDKSLRISMGNAGRRKIKSHYDWQHITKSYEDFWADLAKRRESFGRRKSLNRLLPNYLDPSAAFSHYPTQNLDLGTYLRLISGDKNSAINLVEEYRRLAVINYVNELIPSPDMSAALIKASTLEPKKVEEIIKQYEGSSRHTAHRALAWLVKLGIYTF